MESACIVSAVIVRLELGHVPVERDGVVCVVGGGLEVYFRAYILGKKSSATRTSEQ
jgi:hypothetical protein